MRQKNLLVSGLMLVMMGTAGIFGMGNMIPLAVSQEKHQLFVNYLRDTWNTDPALFCLAGLLMIVLAKAAIVVWGRVARYRAGLDELRCWKRNLSRFGYGAA